MDRQTSLKRGAPILGLTCLLLAACEPETRITKYHPFFANVPDAKTGQPPVGSQRGEFTDPRAIGEDRTIIQNKDGSVTLVSRTVQQLIRHLERTLEDGKQDDLILDQLVAEQTKRYLQAEGTDPREFVAFLHESRRDVAMLFGRLPAGEYSPMVAFEPTGEKQYVVRLTGPAAADLRFTKLWVALEKGNFKLMWLS